MDQILFVDACVRQVSRTRELAQYLLDTLSGQVQRVDVCALRLNALDAAGLERRGKAVAAGDFSHPELAQAKAFAAADIIVIAAPYWDLMFPAALKVYLENVSVAGITFDYSPKGVPMGLCKAKELWYVTTAGGFIGENNFGSAYLEALGRSLFGIQRVNCVYAEAQDISPEMARASMERAQQMVQLWQKQPRTIPQPEKYAREDGAVALGKLTDHGRSRYYVANDFFHMRSDATLHILSRFRTYQQTTEYTCGAACALMVLNWFGKAQFHERAVAQLLETHCTKGSSVEQVADLFDLLGWQVESHASTQPRFATVEEAERFFIQKLDQGIPVLVDWVDWAGHWQVLVGIDTCGTDSPYDDVLIFADPYDVTDHKQDGYYTYPLGRFFGMWREGPCAEKATPYLQPFVAAWPKA